MIQADILKFTGKFFVEQVRDGEIINSFEVFNAVKTVGKNNILDVMFNSGTQSGTWVLGLIDGSGTQTFNDADTMASHAGWSELTAYAEANRPTWTSGAASSASITNASPVVFTLNATNTVHGIFVVNQNTKGGTTGTLWSTVAFGSELSVANGDVLRLTYTLSC